MHLLKFLKLRELSDINERTYSNNAIRRIGILDSVVQSDGCLIEYKEKGRKKPRHDVSLIVSEKSLPMLLKFRELSRELFKRNSKIWKLSKGNYWGMHIRVNNLLRIFEDADINFGDPPIPSHWIMKNDGFFGAYLAGVIDGDGNADIKRPKYPQLLIRITSGKSQTFLAKAIKQKLNCSVNIYHRVADKILRNQKIHGEWFELHFLVSSKNYKFVKRYVLPHVEISHKKDLLEGFFMERFGA